MSTKSREYQALELLGPGTDPESWAVRMALAGLVVSQELQSSVGDKMLMTQQGQLEECYRVNLERQAMNALPMNCGITITITGDAKTGALTIGGHPTPMESNIMIDMQARHEATLIALAAARERGASHVRCRECSEHYGYGPKVLHGPENMRCPCGKLREPYDCQADEWIKA